MLVIIMTQAYKCSIKQQQSNLAMTFQIAIVLTVCYNLEIVKF